MESSQLSGGTEECSSSESGWTTYLASPMHDDDDHSDEEEEEDDDYDDDHNDDDNDDDDHGDDNDDDSMASDASSGPGHREHPSRNGEGDHGMAPFKHNEDEDEDDNKCSSYKKAYNQVGKKRRKNAASTGKGTSAANSASSRVQGLPRSYKIGYDGGRVDGPMW